MEAGMKAAAVNSQQSSLIIEQEHYLSILNIFCFLIFKSFTYLFDKRKKLRRGDTEGKRAPLALLLDSEVSGLQVGSGDLNLGLCIG